MVVRQQFKVLSVSDKVFPDLVDPAAPHTNPDLDLILSCGDLPYYYVEQLFEHYGIPTFFVRGNHENLIEYGVSGTRRAPLGAIDLHRKVVNFNDLLLAGFEGSLRYRNGPFMYTQGEMWANVLLMVPRLLVNYLLHGRFLDVLITHAPPAGIHDQPDHAHQGFQAFRWMLKTFSPSYHFHGHIHVYQPETRTESIFHRTQVINTYGKRTTKIEPGKMHLPEFPIQNPSRPELGSALEDFRHARRKAALQSFFSSITGQSDRLLSFDEVREKLHTGEARQRGLRDIPLDAIVGSVGRTEDFNRRFFPKREENRSRWTRVREIFAEKAVLPPIDVYQIGEVYFVLDGNHRVSVARQRGDSHIRAIVTEVQSKVPLTPADSPDAVIIKAQQVKFLEDTHLDQLRPDIDFTVTSAGSFRKLREQISAHQYFLDIQRGRGVAFQEALLDWVDTIYAPQVRQIRRLGLLRDFPGRTSTDLFLYIMDHRQELIGLLGWDVHPEQAARDFAREYGLHPRRVWQRFRNNLLSFIRPDQLDPGPRPGSWRRGATLPRSEDHLFSSILVPLNGEPSGWQALQHAFSVAEKENAAIRGLHIVSSDQEQRLAPAMAIRDEFISRCESANLEGELVYETGEIAPAILGRTRWNDLLVVGVAHPPEDQPLARLRSGLRTLLQSSSRPVLAVCGPSEFAAALVAYDGSPKADEALFLAAYMADRWDTQISILTVTEGQDHRPESLARARLYFQSRGANARYLHRSGPVSETILSVADEQGCDSIIMGGYGYHPVTEIMLGSSVDSVLRNFQGCVWVTR